MTNESLSLNQEADQSGREAQGRLARLWARGRKALGGLLGDSGVMVDGAPVPVRIDANPQTRIHLFGKENPADYQPGPVPGAAEQGTPNVVSPAELGVSTSIPKTADNLGVKTNSTQDLLRQYIAEIPGAGVPGPDAIGAQKVNPDQNRPVEHRHGVIGQ